MKTMKYVNAGGTIGLRQVDSVLFKQDGVGLGIKVSGYEIWENEYNNDDGAIYINVHGYNGGITKFRQTLIGDGKGVTLANFDPKNNRIQLQKPVSIVGATDITGNTDVDGNLDVTGTGNIDGAVDMNSQLSVDKGIGIGIAGSATYPSLLIASNEASGYAANIQNDGNAANRYGLRIQCGLDTPTDTDSHPIRFFDGNGSYLGALYFDSGHLAIDYVSDAKLKENIKDYDISGLDILNQIQYRSFNWKRDTKEVKTEVHGWIADEIEKIYPEMVGYDENTGYKTIKESKSIPILMSAIKELNVTVKELKSEIEVLKSQK